MANTHFINDLKKIISNVGRFDASVFEEWEGLFETALLIRLVETELLDLFAKGHLSGTVHTCVGQELIPCALSLTLNPDDWFTSNHRCHGHFIAKTGRWKDLIAEVIGLESGVCGGIGGSQHLFDKGFLSNGTQGSLLPVGTGIALNLKKKASEGIVFSFIGEGTLGEGVVYETLNLAVKLQVPQLFVCENNGYSQSTPQSLGLSGSINDRFRAFDVEVFEANTWELSELVDVAAAAVEFTRVSKLPALLNVKTYRLNSHSKGDDDRETDEVEFFKLHDQIEKFSQTDKGRALAKKLNEVIRKEVKELIQDKVLGKVLDYDEYRINKDRVGYSSKTREISNPKARLVDRINKSLFSILESDITGLIVGEDLLDPYGGAFKATKGISTHFPEQIISTPISEAALVGLSLGYSIFNKNTYAEIMFSDFSANAVDQILNNAAKFEFMYNKQITAPIKIRMANGGGKGYGPTHSQSVENLFVGHEGLTIFSLNTLCDPLDVFKCISNIDSPTIILEPKVEYGSFLYSPGPGLSLTQVGGPLGLTRLAPKGEIDFSFITHGRAARTLADNFLTIFEEIDARFEILALCQISPFKLEPIERFVRKSSAVVVIGEGIAEFGWQPYVAFKMQSKFPGKSIAILGGDNCSVPAQPSLEQAREPNIQKIIKLVNQMKGGSNV